MRGDESNKTGFALLKRVPSEMARQAIRKGLDETPSVILLAPPFPFPPPSLPFLPDSRIRKRIRGNTPRGLLGLFSGDGSSEVCPEMPHGNQQGSSADPCLTRHHGSLLSLRSGPREVSHSSFLPFSPSSTSLPSTFWIFDLNFGLCLDYGLTDCASPWPLFRRS